MSDYFKLLVSGAIADGKIDVTAPFDGALIATIETGGSEAVDQALATAHALYRNKSDWLTAEKRIKVLEKTADIMQSRFD